MANRGQSQYIRIYSGATTYQRWQNYYVNQTVTWESQSWQYFPFLASGFVAGGANTASDVSIDLPATEAAISAFETALKQNYLCELRFYEFNSALSQATPQSGQLLIGTIVGEVTDISGSFESISIGLGSSLAPVGAQVPPRKFTDALVGAPIRI